MAPNLYLRRRLHGVALAYPALIYIPFSGLRAPRATAMQARPVFFVVCFWPLAFLLLVAVLLSQHVAVVSVPA